jgi:hypothetical protein
MTTVTQEWLQFFDAILFLLYNRYFWDEKTVQEALLAVKDDQKVDRLEKNAGAQCGGGE